MTQPDIAFVAELEQIVQGRIQQGDETSYTARLVAAGTQRIAQKVGEEGVELALAALAGSRQEIIDEAADLLYHVIVLLTERGLSLEDVALRLAERHAA